MLLKGFALVCLFIVRLRFPANKSISANIRTRYGNDILKKVRRFEKLDYKIRKILLDVSFLESCFSNEVIPNFLHFRTANNRLQNSTSYADCQKLLLQEELSSKNIQLDKVKKEFKLLKKDLCNVMSIFDYLYVTSLFLESNLNSIEKVGIKQNVKLKKLIEANIKHNPKDIIYNFSSHTLTKDQECLLIKGLNFSLPPNKLRYEEYLLPYELLFRDL